MVWRSSHIIISVNKWYSFWAVGRWTLLIYSFVRMNNKSSCGFLWRMYWRENLYPLNTIELNASFLNKCIWIKVVNILSKASEFTCASFQSEAFCCCFNHIHTTHFRIFTVMNCFWNSYQLPWYKQKLQLNSKLKLKRISSSWRNIYSVRFHLLVTFAGNWIVELLW